MEREVVGCWGKCLVVEGSWGLWVGHDYFVYCKLLHVVCREIAREDVYYIESFSVQCFINRLPNSFFKNLRALSIC